MTAVIIVALIGTFAVMWRAIPRNSRFEPAVFRRLLGEGRAIHALAVFMVVAAAFYLALEDKLRPPIITLFSGIAGFAFGSISQGLRRTEEEKSDEEGKMVEQGKPDDRATDKSSKSYTPLSPSAQPENSK